MQIACSPNCAYEWAKRSAEKKRLAEERRLAKIARMEKAAKKESLKTKSDWMKEAQAAFNAYIRARDEHQPCISCDKLPTNQRRYLHLTGGYWDCGHYRSIGSMATLRFCELNAHKQCKQCNRDLSGNAVEYRIRLRIRIGDKQLEWLEGPHEVRKWTIEDLKEIKRLYKAKLKELKQSRSAA